MSDPRLPGQTLTHVAAFGRGREIGRNGGMPWHLPEDFAHFKAVTMGGVILMGRTTFESIGRPLPGRVTIVLTRSDDWMPGGQVPGGGPRFPEVQVAGSLAEALRLAATHPGHHGDGEVFVVGGAQVYKQTLPWASVLELTEVDQAPEGADAFYPQVDPAEFVEVSRDPRDGFAFVRLERR